MLVEPLRDSAGHALLLRCLVLTSESGRGEQAVGVYACLKEGHGDGEGACGRDGREGWTGCAAVGELAWHESRVSGGWPSCGAAI
jgi:hypothetical protein